MCSSDLVRIELCHTTSAELVQRYGQPYRDGQVHRWHVQSFMFDREDEVFLAVLLDDRGVVRDVYYDVPGAIDWVPEDQCPPAPPPPPP